jgi:peptide/nickel transport system substrate-binding protein
MERDDLGWLGLGLHRDRPKARPFDFGDVGWVVLTTGDRARPLAAPGVAQQLANAVNVEALHLGLRPREGLQPGTPWLGEPTSLYYEHGSAHLRVIAERVAAQLSGRGHEIRAASVGPTRWRRLRAKRDYALAIQFVRDPGLGPWAARAALAAVDRRRLAEEMVSRLTRRAPPRPAHLLTANLRVGVLGALSVRGGIAAGWHMPAHVHGGGIDWSSIHRL